MYTVITVFTATSIIIGIGILAWKFTPGIECLSTNLSVVRQCRQCGWCVLSSFNQKKEIFLPDEKCQRQHDFEFVYLPQKESSVKKWIRSH